MKNDRLTIELSQSLQATRPHLQDWIEDTARWCAYLDPDIDLSGVHVTIRQAIKPRSWHGYAWAYSTSIDRRRHKRRKHPSGRITLSFGRLVPRAEAARITAHEFRHIGQFARGKQQKGYLTFDMDRRSCERDCLIFEGMVLRAMGLDDSYWWRNLGWLYKPQTKLVHVKGISDYVNVHVSDRIPKDVIIIKSGGTNA